MSLGRTIRHMLYMHMIALQIQCSDGLNPCGLNSLEFKTKLPSKALLSSLHLKASFRGEFCIVLEEPSTG